MHVEPNKSHRTATDGVNTVPLGLHPLTKPVRPADAVDLLLDDLDAPEQPSATAAE